MTELPLLLPHRRTVADDSASKANMRQLILLRWIAVAGQLITILIVSRGLGLPLPLAPMLTVVALIASFNIISHWAVRRRPIGNLTLFAALCFDVGSLSLLLFFTGGATNPFAALFLLQVVLGALLLEAWSAWVLVGLAGLCFTLLAFHYRPLDFAGYPSPAVDHLILLAQGICIMLIAMLLVFFIGRVGRILRARDAHVAELQRRAAQEDGIVRMGLLASSAAHELGTPLASLDVILGDWRRIPKLADDPVLADEIAEMQQAVARCKAIVTDVLQAAGEPRGQAPEAVASRIFLQEIADEWRAAHPSEPLFLDLQVDDEAIVADLSLRQAIWNLLENAREASPMAVGLAARREDDHLRIEVTDRGEGFSPGALARFGELRQSAKGPGHGVGLFLTANIVRKLGGRLEAANRVGAPGAIVTLILPISTIGATEAAKRWTRTGRSSS